MALPNNVKMPKRKKQIERAKGSIISDLKSSGQFVFKKTELETFYSQYNDKWNLPASISFKKFLNFLVDQNELSVIQLAFPSRTEVRYIFPEASIYEIILSLRNGAYLSHYTAMGIHNLTEQLPKTYYVNFEQSPKPISKAQLSQERIDFAFDRPQRMTNNIAIYGDHKICLLNSKFTDRAGIIKVRKDSLAMDITNIERTLIDIIVRPNYSGGIFEILKAYNAAKDLVSINKLCAILKKINHVYPYHQAIGFCLERTGAFRDNQLKMLRDFGIKYDFYLTYNMKAKEYDGKWRLFYPKGL